MLPFLKRKPDAAGARVPAWHPNFRNYERLPDVKVVRTSFFINGAAVAVAAALVLFFAFQEFKLAALNRQVATWEGEIEADRGASTQAVAMFRTFQAEEKKLQEVDAFRRSKLKLSSFLQRLGAALPEKVAITGIEYRAAGVTLRAVVRGAPELGSGVASAFLQQLQQDEELAATFESVALTNLSRDPATNRLNVQYLLKFPAPAK